MKDGVDEALTAFANRDYANAKVLLENFDYVTEPEAMFALGEIHYLGLAGSVCHETGLKYFRISAGLGNTNAMLRMAGDLGMSSRTQTEAEKYISLAADRGVSNAKKRLGSYALMRSGYHENEIILRAARHGNVDCMLEYAIRVQRGDAEPYFVSRKGFFENRKAKQDAISETLTHWYSRAAIAGEIRTIRYLFTGWSPYPASKNPSLEGLRPNCRKDLEKGAEVGDATSAAIVGFALLFRSQEFYQQLNRKSAVERAIKFLSVAAQQGNPYAAGQLAWEFSWGRSIEENFEMALAYAVISKELDPDFSPDVEGQSDVMLSDLERRIDLGVLEQIRNNPRSFL